MGAYWRGGGVIKLSAMDHGGLLEAGGGGGGLKRGWVLLEEIR